MNHQDDALFKTTYIVKDNFFLYQSTKSLKVGLLLLCRARTAQAEAKNILSEYMYSPSCTSTLVQVTEPAPQLVELTYKL